MKKPILIILSLFIISCSSNDKDEYKNDQSLYENNSLEDYELFDLANDGIGVLVCSSEINEIMNLSDRIYVMCEGTISASFSKTDATPERLLASSLPKAVLA